jgi:hypothetical protein
MWIAVFEFTDRVTGIKYGAGDEYPRSGTVSEERISELAGYGKAAGKPCIIEKEKRRRKRAD